eukprot:CAMPEP_0113934004 /NCGR_PEP_ID=MMETSP1339-20121228/1341_1 /TAXON_ID=94617 /ORGANISM="Fibrocapsa japonica" /LENGTH=611 /DNA_ID=CAMNT_0000935605 /DNA_START=72 /DNA_END=1907 /DNA_ORIENTATION=+ /assembly_acc=CAM_ASM_000762
MGTTLTKAGVPAVTVLTAGAGQDALMVTDVTTTPFEGQKPGTSGLRKKTKEFMQEHYLANFVQCSFDAVKASGTDITRGALLVGGDGRYYNDVAIQTIIQIAAANGVTRIWVGQNGYLSTPATSAVIREKGPVWQKAFGAFILTASHNPGGPEEDFGIKYNCENGGPAPEKLTNAIFEGTKTISAYKLCSAFPAIDITTVGSNRVVSEDGSKAVIVDVIDATAGHIELLKTVFDMAAIKALLSRRDFSMVYDSMHGVQGPYAHKVFVDELGQSASCLINAVPKDDFGGGHADPNLTYAKDLIKIMGVDSKGQPVDTAKPPPAFGAAADGDADRNMILGNQFFVTPSDSVAIIAFYADKCIPFFRDQGGLKGVARSMPTSGALDLVAKDLNVPFFETPTGWKFFGNLMDSGLLGKEDLSPFICGEESFGTGSDHVREKDGMWAVLAWLAILAYRNPDPSQPLVSVQQIVEEHWAKYGRNYYSRYDYEGVEKDKAVAMMNDLIGRFRQLKGQTIEGYTISVADEFEYKDPVDGSVASNQGVRILFSDGSRIIFRLSGTAGSGATVRMYLEKYEAASGDLAQKTSDALGALVKIALDLSKLQEFTGRESPTVIT